MKQNDRSLLCNYSSSPYRKLKINWQEKIKTP